VLADWRGIGHDACVAARTRLWAVLAFGCAVIVAAGCSGSGSSQSTKPLPTTTTTLAGMPCSFSAPSCTPAQVRTTLTTLFERSGTTPTEANCLAALTAPAHSMIEEFRAGDPSKDAAAARCVGSNARLDGVGAQLLATLTQIDPQFARSVDQPQDCKSSSSVTVVPMPGTTGPAPSDWYKLTPEQLRKAGWRQVEIDASPTSCEPAP
jgi:hypothetical protein